MVALSIDLKKVIRQEGKQSCHFTVYAVTFPLVASTVRAGSDRKCAMGIAGMKGAGNRLAMPDWAGLCAALQISIERPSRTKAGVVRGEN